MSMQTTRWLGIGGLGHMAMSSRRMPSVRAAYKQPTRWQTRLLLASHGRPGQCHASPAIVPHLKVNSP